MALWQFDLLFVPRGGPMPVRSEDGYDVPPLSEPFANKAQAVLSERIGQPWLMCEDWLVFGEETGSRFDFLRTESGGAELSVRVDARSEFKAFLQLVCELASRLNCVLIPAETGAVVEPEPTSLTRALEGSRAVAFVRSPQEFLRGIQSDG